MKNKSRKTKKNINKKLKKMDYSEIMGRIKETGIDVSDFAYEDVTQDNREKIGKWNEVEQHGGEGEGEDWYSVKYFPEHDIYIKVSGFYQSYSGTDFGDFDDACKEVKPIERKVTFYEPLQ